MSLPQLEIILKGFHVYWVVVDYDQPFDTMIAKGAYDRVSKNLTFQNYPIQGAGKHEVKFVLVDLNRFATTKEALKELNNLGLEPARIEHLLAFGTTYQKVQQSICPIGCIGSVKVAEDGDKIYPFLHWLDSERILERARHLVGAQWDNRCWFLAILP